MTAHAAKEERLDRYSEAIFDKVKRNVIWGGVEPSQFWSSHLILH